MVNLYAPSEPQYTVDSILLISNEHKTIMGECLSDRITGYLAGHRIPISAPLPELLPQVPIGILTDLRTKMIGLMEGPEVRKSLQESPPDYGEEEYICTFEYDESEDF